MHEFSDLQIFRASLNDRTWGLYSRAWRNFVAFLRVHTEAHPSTTLSFNIDLLCKYATWRFRISGVKGATIQADISGINAFLHYYGYGINLHQGNSDPLKRLYRGIDRIRRVYQIGRRSVYRRAMTIKMLNKLLIYLKLEDKFMRVMRAVVLFGYATGFRSHNYVLTDRGGYVKLKHIKFYPNVDEPTHLLINLPYAKTHQIDSPVGESRVLKCQCNKGDLCAVHEVAALVAQRYKFSKHRNRALFLLPDGSPVTYYFLKETLKNLCMLYNLQPKYYTPHCLRIGIATHLHIKKITLPAIMKRLGWTSRRSAMKYIRPNNPDFVLFGIDDWMFD